MDKLTVRTFNNNDKTYLFFVPPTIGERTSRNLTIVIDKSGSMKNEVTAGTERNGFTRMILVKHSVRTIINTLDEGDKLALITFDSHSTLVLPPSSMTEQNKAKAHAIVDNINAEGRTSLFPALQLAFQTGGEVLVLTDGATSKPQSSNSGFISALQSEFRRTPLKNSVHSFGFSNAVESDLLEDISRECFGSFSFIPSGDMVGTVFINALSDLLSTYATNVRVNVGGKTIRMGNIGFGQERCIILDQQPNHQQITVTYDSLRTKQTETVVATASHPNPKDIVNNNIRMQIPVVIQQAINDQVKGNRNACNRINAFIAEIKSAVEYLRENNSDTKFLEDIIRDFEGGEDNNGRAFEGQVSLAFSDKFYDDWGVHWLRSYMSAHINQRCNNFKDFGVQSYSGPLNTQLKAIIQDIFANIPAPEPDKDVVEEIYNSSRHGQGAGYTQVASMASYVNPNGGCFHGNCVVKMADGTNKLVREVKIGDRLSNGTIRFVTKFMTNGSILMVQLNNLLVTPFHPVKIDNRWSFPINHGQMIEVSTDAVYDFVLDPDSSSHTAEISDITCVTLGHNYNEPVVEHEYFGSQRVIDDIIQLGTTDEGYTIVHPHYLNRDPVTNRICSIRNPEFDIVTHNNISTNDRKPIAV